MTVQQIISELLTPLAGVEVVVASEANGAPEAAWGDVVAFYDPDGEGASAGALPFAAMLTRDQAGVDTASDLDREDVYRLDLWCGRSAVRAVTSERAATDPTAIDVLMPHPIRADEGWIAILNPSEQRRPAVQGLLEEAYEAAVARHRDARDR